MTSKKTSGFTRKHFYIDRNLQGKYMLTFLIPMIIMLFFMLFTLYFASEAIISTTTRIMRRDMESTIVYALQDQINPTAEQYKSLIDQLNDYVRGFSTNDDLRHELLKSLLLVFVAGLFLVIIQIVLLTIFFSHKLAGPVYRFEKACKDIIDGSYKDEIKLRKGDQLTNLATLLNEAVRVTRERMLALKSGSEKEKDEVNEQLKL